MNIGHAPLHNPHTAAFINELFAKLTYDQLEAVTAARFEQAWRNWLQSSNHNTVVGLDNFEHCVFVPGTTDAFGEFIARNHTRRVRVSRSDFILSRILSKTWNIDYLELEQAPLAANDCYLTSLPFSGNGQVHPDFINNLRTADDLGVPVFLDAAYFGIAHGITYPLQFQCITDFATSLSKGLAGKPLRLGVRFTRQAYDDGASAAMVGMDTFDRLGALISIELLNNFSHDWFIETYRDRSHKICQEFGLTPTNVVTLAMGDQRYKEFQRGDYIRVCISDELSQTS